MNSTDYSNNLFAAIDIILDQKLQKLKADQTIKGKIVAVNKTVSPIIYSIEYQGQIFTATAIDESIEYITNMVAFILIPQGDMTNNKFLIAPFRAEY